MTIRLTEREGGSEWRKDELYIIIIII